MKHIRHNPYRIIGLLSNTTEREINRQKSKLTRFASVGKEISCEFDFPFLGEISRSEVTINQSFSNIEQGQEKIFNSLYWFSISNSSDGAAFAFLSQGDKMKALEKWEELTRNKDITDENISSFNNLGTLLLSGNSYYEIQAGIDLKVRLVNAPQFDHFVSKIADKTVRIEKKLLIEKFCNSLLDELISKFSKKELLGLFKNSPSNITEYIINKFAIDPIEKIEKEIENSKNDRRNSKTVNASQGLALYRNCGNVISELKDLLGSETIQYKIVTDNLAKEILQCGIDFFVDNGESESDVDKAIQIIEKAKLICTSELTKNRINDQINEIKSVKFQDIHLMLAVLKALKDAIKELNKNNIGKLYYEKQTMNKTKVDELLQKEITQARIIKLVNSNEKSHLTDFIDFLESIRSSMITPRITKIIDLLNTNLPSIHPFVIKEKQRKKKLEEDLARKTAEAEQNARKKRIEEETRRIREAERTAELKRKEKEENEQFILKLIGVISVILIVAGAIWGWDGVIGAIIVGVLIVINGSK
jgi:hypothetical protein